MNLNGKVPLMLIDGQPVFESLAMLLYLAETYAVGQLRGRRWRVP